MIEVVEIDGRRIQVNIPEAMQGIKERCFEGIQICLRITNAAKDMKSARDAKDAKHDANENISFFMDELKRLKDDMKPTAIVYHALMVDSVITLLKKTEEIILHYKVLIPRSK